MQLYCPMCREPNANVKLSLVDGDTFTCEDCGEEFTFEDVVNVINAARKWADVLAWVERCPARRETSDAEK